MPVKAVFNLYTVKLEMYNFDTKTGYDSKQIKLNTNCSELL